MIIHAVGAIAALAVLAALLAAGDGVRQPQPPRQSEARIAAWWVLAALLAIVLAIVLTAKAIQ